MRSMRSYHDFNKFWVCFLMFPGEFLQKQSMVYRVDFRFPRVLCLNLSLNWLQVHFVWFPIFFISYLLPHITVPRISGTGRAVR